MPQRPLTIPFPQAAAQLRCLRRLMACRDVPYDYHTLHRPHPRRHFLNTLATPLLRRLDIHYLFTRAEQDFNRPSPGEHGDHPRQARLPIRGEQVAITHPARWVTHDYYLDDTIAQHGGPDRLV